MKPNRTILARSGGAALYRIDMLWRIRYAVRWPKADGFCYGLCLNKEHAKEVFSYVAGLGPETAA